MKTGTIAYACARAGIQAGRRIRGLVHGMPARQRARRCTAALKSRAVPYADRAAEDLGIAHLERLSRRIGYGIQLIVDPGTAETLPIGRSTRPDVVWAYFDAVDGTIKVAGIGNDLVHGRFRAANDGAWASAMAFTTPTRKRLDELVIADFVAAAIVDANPPRHRTYPAEVMVLPAGGQLRSYDVSAAAPRRVFTSTNTVFNQSTVFLDVYQAYDRETRAAGDEALGVELYRLLTNRHEHGAFDVLRQYANLSALVRMMLGWRGRRPWYESQGGAFVVVNENLANLIPAVPVIAGAGGISVDFDGRPLMERTIVAGRSSVVHAANDAMQRQAISVVKRARELAGSRVESRESRVGSRSLPAPDS